MDEKEGGSVASLTKATQSIVDFSGHGASLGAAGFRAKSDHPENCEFLEEPGQSIAISPGADGFDFIKVGVAWDNMHMQNSGVFSKFFKKARKVGIDLDIGCLYEMVDGTRGSLQAFGGKFGDFDAAPFVSLSGDERTGNSQGDDEFLLINGRKWREIKRMLIYIYIYDGAPSWSVINPQVVIDVPGEDDLYVTLNAHDDALSLCAVGELESIRGGVRLTNRTEYFPGHDEMDRAFGYGLEWADGKK